MNKQMVMWTALPNGIVGDATHRTLRLSVFVTPRLQPDREERATGAVWPIPRLAGRICNPAK